MDKGCAPRETFPAPDEKRDSPTPKPSGFGPGGSIATSDPFGASYDSSPMPTDNRPGATRPGGARRRSTGGSVRSARQNGSTTYD